MQKYEYNEDSASAWMTPRPTMPDHGTLSFYLASEVDGVLKRQASAARAGMNAATAISSGQVEQARRLRAESSPEALESERQANAILTERVAELEQACKENARYSTEMREEFERRGERIAELEKQIEQLQLALAFWLPNVPENGDLYIINRIGDHAILLCGLNTEPEQSAQDRGWITLDASE